MDEKVLMVVTNTTIVPDTDIESGFFFRELTHPYLAALEAGFEIDIASPKGGDAQIDPHSDPRRPESAIKDDIVSIGFIDSPRHAAKLKDTPKLAEVDLGKYDAIFFAGGAGAIFDLPNDPNVARAVEQVWEQGGVVGAVCHGVGALLGARRPDGRPLVEGFETTGVTRAEEDDIHRQVEQYVAPLQLQDELPARGARFVDAGTYVANAVTSGDGRLVTGQNNRSGTVVGRALVDAITANAARRHDA